MKSLGAHWYFSQAFKNPFRPSSDPLFNTCCKNTYALTLAEHTHRHTRVRTHKPCIALKCASVWSVSVSGALTRHHSSCFLTTIQSNTGLQDWAKTLFHRDGCYYGNCGGVRPTSKPENAVLFCLGLFFAEKTPTLCLCICLLLFPSLLLFPMWEKHIPPRS